MPPIRSRDFFMPVGAFTMAIVLGLYARASIKAARENAAHERYKQAGRTDMEREKLGLEPIYRRGR